MIGDARGDSAIIDAIDARRAELGDAAPRFALFLCDCSDADAIRKTLSRIPDGLGDWFEEVVIMLDRPTGGSMFDIRWNTFPGLTYFLECDTDLGFSNSTVLGPILADGLFLAPNVQLDNGGHDFVRARRE